MRSLDWFWVRLWAFQAPPLRIPWLQKLGSLMPSSQPNLWSMRRQRSFFQAPLPPASFGQVLSLVKSTFCGAQRQHSIEQPSTSRVFREPPASLSPQPSQLLPPPLAPPHYFLSATPIPDPVDQLLPSKPDYYLAVHPELHLSEGWQ